MNSAQLKKEVTGYIKGHHPDILVIQMPDDILLDVMIYSPKINHMPSGGMVVPVLKYLGLAICIKEPEQEPTRDQWDNIGKLIKSQWAVQVCYSLNEAQIAVNGYLGTPINLNN